MTGAPTVSPLLSGRTHETRELQTTPGPFLYSCHPNC